MNKFINYVHRGASVYILENTISAFRKAMELQDKKTKRYGTSLCFLNFYASTVPSTKIPKISL